MAPLELIHSDLCEMNGVLTKGGKKYFMTLIDDSTRYCRVYLLKSNFFKIYKTKVETNLIIKSRGLGPTMVERIFSINLILFVRNMALVMRGRLPIHPSQTGLPSGKTVL